MLVGAIGLIKLNNPMSRMHAPTKSSTLGIGAMLLASMIYSFVSDNASLHEVLVMAFLFVSTPISAIFVAKVNLHRMRNKKDLPPPPTEHVWGTFSK
jgi:multicomponent K+:H+ antiporter subunit G